MKPNSITITYLAKVTFSSLNGSDKDVDNINPIKKIRVNNEVELPYVSSQAIRRALRDKLEEMGESISKVTAGDGAKTPPVTENNPKERVDDDLFGYMDAKKFTQRTSPIRVEALIALNKYQGDLDFGTNLQGSKGGENPNIFETEIHSGLYRGSILIELDRIGNGIKEKKGFDDSDYIDNKEKARRVNAFLDAFQNLWSSGRQTRFLADISPKFIAAAYMSSKNPIFLESVNIKDSKVNVNSLESVLIDYDRFIDKHVFAAQSATLNTDKQVENIKEGFAQLQSWVNEYYQV